MRIPKLSIYFVFCCLLSCAGESVEEWRTFDLLSPVKSIVEQRYLASQLPDGEWEIGSVAPFAAETHFFFDEAGNYVRSEFFREGWLSERWETLRKGGELSGWVVYDAEGAIQSESELVRSTIKESVVNDYELAENGDRILVSTTFSKLNKGKAYYREQTFFSSGDEEDKQYISALEYTANGLRKKVKLTGPNNYEVVINFEYLTFDEAGNWTQRLDASIGQASGSEIVLRSYEYY